MAALRASRAGHGRRQGSPIPINRDTINRLYGLSLSTDEEVEAFFQSRAEPVETVRTSEDVVVGRVGRELYEKFFQGYTRKQWGLDPSQLDKSVTARVPVRTNTDDRYFTDTFQQMPLHGYTKMFEKMLAHPNIHVMLQTDWNDIKSRVPHKRLIFTGAIDEYFGHRFGKLPYRSLRFDHRTLDQEWHQPVGTVNYPQTEDYTRISEYKHPHRPEAPPDDGHLRYPSAEGDPIIRSRARRTRSCSSATRAWRLRRRTSGSSAASPPTATTTWTRWWGRRSRPSAASRRRSARAWPSDQRGEESAGGRGPAGGQTAAV